MTNHQQKDGFVEIQRLGLISTKFEGEVEGLSEMVGVIEGMSNRGQDSSRSLQKELEDKRRMEGKGSFFMFK